MGSLNFSMRDLYPTMGITETSTEVIPEADDMDALNENVKDAQEASKTFARGKFMLVSVVVLLGVVFFLGGGE